MPATTPSAAAPLPADELAALAAALPDRSNATELPPDENFALIARMLSDVGRSARSMHRVMERAAQAGLTDDEFRRALR